MRFYVSQYVVDRCYGGPEEGGWYYDWEDFQSVVAEFTDEAEAYSYARACNGFIREQFGEPDRFSVIGSPDVVCYVESEIGEHQTTKRPHYC
jgi:hypothetical protein